MPSSLSAVLPLLLAGRAWGIAQRVDPNAHITQVYVGQHIESSCTPGAWSDYVITIDESLMTYNLLFEVEDIGTPMNPDGLFVALWEEAVPIDRAAEHFADSANGKIWAVGMNNNCACCSPRRACRPRIDRPFPPIQASSWAT